ncbi:hypothetical protein ACH492_17710 [Streptomyces sp. NPDC019443]|uniref:hypothetical protein n=1 Tax=Streptomyces sp. NPDC019443 TaxID=3365061 RepID=UPI0037B1738A
MHAFKDEWSLWVPHQGSASAPELAAELGGPVEGGGASHERQQSKLAPAGPQLAHRPTVTRCGKRTFPQYGDRHGATGRFADEDLCGACYRTLTPEDQERAFEHEQPELTSE